MIAVQTSISVWTSTFLKTEADVKEVDESFFFFLFVVIPASIVWKTQRTRPAK